MDLDDQLDSLHLSEPSHSKRRRLSGILVQKKNMRLPSGEFDSVESPECKSLPLLIEENTLSDIDGKPSLRRSGRKKSAPVRWDNKNDSSLKNSLSSDNPAAVEKYYLDKTIKRTTTSLETIFEEAHENKTNLRNVMSVRKLRRSIIFSDKVHPGKIRKRQLKASKTNSKKKIKIRTSLEDLYTKLSSIIEQD